MTDDTQLRDILARARTIAVVGLSPDPARPSNGVARYLMGAGYRVIPVNPIVDNVLGLDSYRSLEEVPGQIDIVDVFRRGEHLPGIADSAVAAHAGVLWMQLGVLNYEAAATARAGGLQVVMNRCTEIEHRRLVAHGTGR